MSTGQNGMDKTYPGTQGRGATSYPAAPTGAQPRTGPTSPDGSRPLEKKIVGTPDFSVLLVSICGIRASRRAHAAGLPHISCPTIMRITGWSNIGTLHRNADPGGCPTDAFQCEVLKIPFHPLDVPRDQFIVAATPGKCAGAGRLTRIVSVSLTCTAGFCTR